MKLLIQILGSLLLVFGGGCALTAFSFAVGSNGFDSQMILIVLIGGVLPIAAGVLMLRAIREDKEPAPKPDDQQETKT